MRGGVAVFGGLVSRRVCLFFCFPDEMVLALLAQRDYLCRRIAICDGGGGGVFVCC